MPEDLHLLPKLRDSLSFLYLEHCVIEQEAKSIAALTASGSTAIPCAGLTLLMLGPGTTITHAAIRTLAENGCLVLWTGEEGVRMYALGLGETRSAARLIRQAALVSDPAQRLAVIRKMYELRFGEPIDPALSLQQIRGREGRRVREAYAKASAETGVPWEGRHYRRQRWTAADPINRAISAANSALYGICHAAIVSLGYSPALGFIHTGKMLSFVYDIADLYKAEIAIPVAFRVTAEGTEDLERRVRIRLRDRFRETRLLERVVLDIERLLGGEAEEEAALDSDDPALPGGLWDGEGGVVAGGVNWDDRAGAGTGIAEPAG